MSVKSSPHSFFQQINNNEQRKEKVAKRKENQLHISLLNKLLLINGCKSKGRVGSIDAFSCILIAKQIYSLFLHKIQ